MGKRKRKPLQGLRLFEARLKQAGWRTSADGEDFCPKCWGRYHQQFNDEDRAWAKADARPTWKFAYLRFGADNWHAMCEKCHTVITAPFTDGERKRIEEYKASARKRRKG